MLKLIVGTKGSGKTKAMIEGRQDHLRQHCCH